MSQRSLVDALLQNIAERHLERKLEEAAVEVEHSRFILCTLAVQIYRTIEPDENGRRVVTLSKKEFDETFSQEGLVFHSTINRDGDGNIKSFTAEVADERNLTEEEREEVAMARAAQAELAKSFK